MSGAPTNVAIHAAALGAATGRPGPLVVMIHAQTVRAAIERGLAFTLHTDSRVVSPDMVRTLWSATTRRTRGGDILGPAQRIGIAETLAGLTANATRQYGETDQKGMIRAGLLADLVVLSRDPLGVDPELLRDVRVMETVSRGRYSVSRAVGDHGFAGARSFGYSVHRLT